MKRVAVEVAGPIRPCFGCEARNVSNECIAFPVPDRVSHIGIDRVKSDLIEMNSPFGAGAFEDHEHLHCSLNDLKLYSMYMARGTPGLKHPISGSRSSQLAGFSCFLFAAHG
jgi:hypothetical protein